MGDGGGEYVVVQVGSCQGGNAGLMAGCFTPTCHRRETGGYRYPSKIGTEREREREREVKSNVTLSPLK